MKTKIEMYVMYDMRWADAFGNRICAQVNRFHYDGKLYVSLLTMNEGYFCDDYARSNIIEAIKGWIDKKVCSVADRKGITFPVSVTQYGVDWGLS